MTTPVCGIAGSQQLGRAGWSELRNLSNDEPPFRLFRDEGRTFLQVGVIRRRRKNDNLSPGYYTGARSQLVARIRSRRSTVAITALREEIWYLRAGGLRRELTKMHRFPGYHPCPSSAEPGASKLRPSITVISSQALDGARQERKKFPCAREANWRILIRERATEHAKGQPNNRGNLRN